MRRFRDPAGDLELFTGMASAPPASITLEGLYEVARSYLPEALPLIGVPRSDVEDLLHDIVIAAHEGIERHHGQLAPVADDADPARTMKAWLSAVAWRQVSNRRRRAFRRFEVPCGD